MRTQFKMVKLPVRMCSHVFALASEVGEINASRHGPHVYSETRTTPIPYFYYCPGNLGAA